MLRAKRAHLVAELLVERRQERKLLPQLAQAVESFVAILRGVLHCLIDLLDDRRNHGDPEEDERQDQAEVDQKDRGAAREATTVQTVDERPKPGSKDHGDQDLHQDLAQLKRQPQRETDAHRDQHDSDREGPGVAGTDL